jgi:hypothetical protein
MSKKLAIIFGIVAAVIVLLGLSCGSPSERRGKIVTQLQKKDAGGYTHTVTVRQFAGRFRTELGDEGSESRILPVSSYEFYEGSSPIKSATIAWPELHKFSVSFDNGITVDCSWSETIVVWTRH